MVDLDPEDPDPHLGLERGGGPRRRQAAPPSAAGGGPSEPAGGPAAGEMAEVDRILDKILAQGESSLTEREREVLRRQARKKQEGQA